jgi:pimeloyl-ACP methyl ester carboxylesterase
MTELRFSFLFLLSLIVACNSYSKEGSSGYFGSAKSIFLVHSGCLVKKEEILIFIHGSPGNWKDYKNYLVNPKLIQRFCIIALDRPGFGNSIPNSSVPSLDLQTDLILDAINDFKKISNLNLSKLIIVGHSYAGPLATKILIQNNENANTLLLIASPMDYKLENVRWYNHLAESWAVKWLLPKEITHSNDEMLPLRDQLKALSEGWVDTPFGVVIIHGKKDWLVPFENIDFVKSKVGNKLIKSIELEDENHFIPWTQEDLVVDTILDLGK